MIIQNEPEKNASVPWKVFPKNDRIELSQYQKKFDEYLQSGFYNCSVNMSLCPICGLPKQSNLPGTKCWSKKNHKRLEYADGVFQIGFYYNKESQDEMKSGDYIHLVKTLDGEFGADDYDYTVGIIFETTNEDLL